MRIRGPVLGMASLIAGVVVAPWSARAAPVDVPIDAGLGPAVFVIAGPMFADQPIHLGMRLQLKALLDREFVAANEAAMPSALAKRVRDKGELRVDFKVLPESLFLSPQRRNSSIWGATWKLAALTRSLGQNPRLRVGAGVVATYAYIRSKTLRSPTHFIRPGADLNVELDVGLSDRFHLSFGGSSQFYVPQQMGQLRIGKLRRAIWHIGQIFLVLHIRMPVEVNL